MDTKDYVRFLMHYGQSDNIQKSMAIISIVLLFIILVVGLILANGFALHVDYFDEIIATLQKYNDKAVTILFNLIITANVTWFIQNNSDKDDQTKKSNV